MLMSSTRVVIVTGAGSGIGAAVAGLLAAGSARVVIAGRRRASLDAVAATTGALTHVADLTAPGGVEGLVRVAADAYGRIDGVVANAGVVRPGGLLDLTDDDWRATLDTNLSSVFRLARAALPYLLDSGGAWVTVSSIAGLRASSGVAAYAVSKAAVTMLTQTMAVEFGARGVRANVVCPGWTRTEMADEEMREFGEPLGVSVDEAYAEVTRVVPQRRPAGAEEVARAVCWLLGPEASAINGSVLTVDGGTTAVDPGTLAFDFAINPRDGG
jgi:meso-butanediol dehydrogenase / (S,S)-butanediol dehydrogenase / diacetyl reductase